MKCFCFLSLLAFGVRVLENRCYRRVSLFSPFPAKVFFLEISGNVSEWLGTWRDMCVLEVGPISDHLNESSIQNAFVVG